MPSNAEDREKSLAEARKWSAKCKIHVIVYWIQSDLILRKLEDYFFAGSELLEHDDQRVIRLMTEPVTEPRPAWTAGLMDGMRSAIAAIEDARMGEQQFFRTSSFAHAAQGILTFDLFDYAALESHGTVAFGGGENVLLEFASKYLNSESGRPKIAIIEGEHKYSQKPSRFPTVHDSNLPRLRKACSRHSAGLIAAFGFIQ